MKFFRLMRANIDLAPFLSELSVVNDAWSIATGRQEKVQVQREALAARDEDEYRRRLRLYEAAQAVVGRSAAAPSAAIAAGG